MQALRQRAAGVARRARTPNVQSTRSYASEHSAPQVNEGLGLPVYIFAGAIPASMLAYSISRPGKDGEPSSLTTWLSQFNAFAETETRNTLRTAMFEQAAHDKHLFNNAGKSGHVDLNTPELMNSGCPYNVPAGFYPRMDHVTEHYRKVAEEEDQRVAKRMAAAAAAAEKKEQESSSSS